MRFERIIVIFLAFYLTFLGGGSYYALSFSIRVAHHGIITILLLAWLIWRIRSNRGMPITPLNTPLYAAAGVWFITAALSIDPRMAFEHIWFPLTHVLFFLVIADLIQRGRQKLVLEAVFFMGAVVILLSGIELASWYFGLGLLPGTQIGWAGAGMLPTLRDIPDVSLAMGISTLLAGYVAPLVIITGTWGLTASRHSYRVVLLVMSLLLLIILVLTDSRGGLLAILVGAAVFTLSQMLRSARITSLIPPRWIMGVGAICGIMLAALFIYQTLPAGAAGLSNRGRLDMWRSAVAITVDDPLTGVGPGLFGRAFRSYRDPAIAQDKLASAHNVYLNTASETGLLGTAVSAWLLVALVTHTWRRWQRSKHTGERRRIEGAAAALVAVATHSLVDVFTGTPIVLLIAVLAAYLTVPPPTSRLTPPARGRQLPAYAALLVVIGYGAAFSQFDRAQSHYMNSLDVSDSQFALNQVRLARQIDPQLRLYALHEAFILGTTDRTQEAITAYQQALELEPTWDVGHIQLAALYEQQGMYQEALAHLDQARRINYFNSAWLHWGRIAEERSAEPETAIIDAYATAAANPLHEFLPVAAFWGETELRLQGIDRYLQDLSIEVQYRVRSVHQPEEARRLVPQTPEQAAEWWILGEHALQESTAQEAAGHFSTAVQLAPRRGDFYAARARARAAFDPAGAHADLDQAQRLGTRYEYPGLIHGALIDDREQALAVQAAALPPRIVRQEFAAVLYARPAVFDVPPSMRYPGPGEELLRPWIDIVQNHIAAGETTQARRVLEFIYQQAPYNEAVQRLRESLSAP